MGADQLRISLLGEFTASYGGAVLELGGRRQRAVLAVLVLARGEVVPAERLADAVWGEHAPGNTAGALQSYVSHLRRSLQPGAPARARSAVVVREGPGYAVRLPPDAVDAWRFETLLQKTTTSPAETEAVLREALALWRGPALVEYADEPWAGAEIARLTELRAVGRERLLAARLDLGEAALVAAELEGMVAEEPLREERWRLLALGLYRAHRQADALAALRRARETLADELGVDPGPALRELEAQVLAQSPELVPAKQPREEKGPTTAANHNGLVDRDRELAALRSMLDGLAGGQPGLLLVEGPAGIGKTRLLAEARRLAAERSVRVLSARGSSLESAFAFGVVRQLFEAEVGRSDELLRGAAAGAGAVFDIADGGRAEGFAVLHGLYWLAVNLSAEGPLVLAVDDAQWCDGASLRFLAYLVRRLAAVPVLVLATLRTGEQNEHEDLIAELALEPEALVVRPAPLSVEATAELVERRLGVRPAPLFVTACERTTAGNPFLLCQLLQALAADGVRPDASHADRVVAVGSRAVSSRVLLQLRRLPPEVVVVARAASVLGDGATLPAVAALAGIPEDRTAEALAALARTEIVRDEQPVAFVHPLVRDAVYHALPAAERGLCHERAASVLKEARTSDELIAAHVLLAPPRGDENVVTLLRTAARGAAERGASESAVTYLRRALTESPTGSWRSDVVLELGMREAPVDGAAAVEHLVQAYRLHDDPRVRSEIAIAAASTQVFASPPGVATAFAREAAAALPDGLADQRQALIAIQRISGFMHSIGDGWQAPAQEPEGQGPGSRMLAATVALEAVLAGSDRERAIAMARFALDGDHLIAVDDGLFWVNAAAVRILSDDDIGDFWSRARAASHARGSLFATLSTSLWEGFWQWRRGELEAALASLAAALDQDRLWGGTRVGEPFARAFQIGCELDRGDLAAARRAADAFADGAAFGEGGRVYQQAVARLLVAEGRCDEALVVLGSPQPTENGIAIVNPAWNPWRSIKAAALYGLGRTSEAIETAEEELVLLRVWGAPSFLGRTLCMLGEFRGRAGLDDLVEAVDLLSSTPAAVDLARAQCALGSHPDVADDDAITLLEAASRLAEERSAGQVRERALAELARRGRRIDPGFSGSGISQVRAGTMTYDQSGRLQ
ncbi:BTAD domain-containing putative transcriptional regulator [Kribbella sp. NPDC026596]|uniref:BTAD domain-containing putative transcriptional regulator n=1 Tax=Kribbella sp. NPDC026596 TaxID=3155122 RepID=UPI0033EE04D8